MMWRFFFFLFCCLVEPMKSESNQSLGFQSTEFHIGLRCVLCTQISVCRLDWCYFKCLQGTWIGRGGGLPFMWVCERYSFVNIVYTYIYYVIFILLLFIFIVVLTANQILVLFNMKICKEAIYLMTTVWSTAQMFNFWAYKSKI